MSKVKYTLPKIEDMLDSGVHFGHQVRRWNPRMEKYIFAHRKGIHIIDLEQTQDLLKAACEALYEIASRGEQVIFVGTKKQALDVVKSQAEQCGALYVNDRWLGGTITNFDVIKKSVDKLVELKRKKEAGELKHYTKKERLMIDREIEKLEKKVGGIVGLRGKPSALFVVDPKREQTAVREARIYDIPVFSLIDTNSDPTLVNYPIPGNDDAIRSILLVVKAVSEAVGAGYKFHAENKDKLDQRQPSQDGKGSTDVEKNPPEIKSASDVSAIKVTTTESPVSTKDAGKKAPADVVVVTEEKEEGDVAPVDSSVKTKKATTAKKAKKPVKKVSKEKK